MFFRGDLSIRFSRREESDVCERAEDRKGERDNIEEGKGDERGQDERSKKDCMWGCAS